MRAGMGVGVPVWSLVLTDTSHPVRDPVGREGSLMISFRLLVGHQGSDPFLWSLPGRAASSSLASSHGNPQKTSSGTAMLLTRPFRRCTSWQTWGPMESEWHFTLPALALLSVTQQHLSVLAVWNEESFSFYSEEKCVP